MTNPTPTRGDETPVDELLTAAEWDALGHAMVPDWETATPTAKKIWRGFARDLAIGYRLGLATRRVVAENGADRPVRRTADAALDCGDCGDTIWPTEHVYELAERRVRCLICQVKSSGRGADQ